MITLKTLRWDNCFSYGENNEVDLSDNKLTQIPVKKVLLPHAQPMNPQAGTSVDQNLKGHVYVRQDKTLCKSTDGGETWEKNLDWSYEQKEGVQAVRLNPLAKIA